FIPGAARFRVERNSGLVWQGCWLCRRKYYYLMNPLLLRISAEQISWRDYCRNGLKTPVACLSLPRILLRRLCAWLMKLFSWRMGELWRLEALNICSITPRNPRPRRFSLIGLSE